MKKIIATNPTNTTALIARLALGLSLFPHGAQKLFGWFGGYGFTGTMGFLTGSAHLPTFIAVLVILIESKTIDFTTLNGFYKLFIFLKLEFKLFYFIC